MAEAILRHLSRGRIVVMSAGSVPQAEVHPKARQAVRNVLRTQMVHQHPKPIRMFLGQEFDYIITVCDRAADSCPVFPGDPERIHWGFDDPALVAGSDQDQQRAFDAVARQLVRRIRILMALPRIREASQPPAETGR